MKTELVAYTTLRKGLVVQEGRVNENGDLFLKDGTQLLSVPLKRYPFLGKKIASRESVGLR